MVDDKANPKGTGIPYFEKYVSLVKPEEVAANKTNLSESYNNIGAWYSDKDKTKAIDAFTKSLALDPADTYAAARLKELQSPAPATKAKGKGK